MIKKINKKFILLVLLLAIPVAVMHFLFYFILVDIFSFLPSFSFSVLLVGLVFSMVSVFLSQVLISYKDNNYSNAYYFLTASWIAFCWQVFVAYFFVFAIRLVSNWWFGPQPLIFAIIFSGVAVGLSAYGFRNAFSPRLKNFEVAIDNLPDFWSGKKIVQLSDVHLGAVYRHNFLLKIAAMIAKIKPEVVLITGDLFDGTDGDFSEAGKALLSLHAPSGVYFVYGNHENYLGRIGVAEHLSGSGIEILDNKIAEISGLQIIGVTYPEDSSREILGVGYPEGVKLDLQKIISLLPKFDRSKPQILMFHEPIQFEEVANLGIDLYLAGHTHNGQMFPFNFVADFAYKRFSVGVKKFKQMTAIISAGVGTWGPPCRTSSRSEIVVITLLKK